MGMTDKRYQDILLENLDNGMEMLKLVRKTGDENAIRKAQQQVDKINEKLKA